MGYGTVRLVFTLQKRLWTHTLMVKEMLSLFLNKERFLCVECLGLVTTFSGPHSYVYLRYKLSQDTSQKYKYWVEGQENWKQKNTLCSDKYSRICYKQQQ